VTVEGTVAQVLDPGTCWQLLRGTDVGRVAMCTGTSPDIVPVNYAVDEGALVIRTALGTRLAAVAAQAGAVAFEVDGHDLAADEAWSVVLTGQAEMVHGFTGVLDAAYLPVYPWQGGRKTLFVRIVVREVSGRRFRKVDRSFWEPFAGMQPLPGFD
jgi:uncharacterized protein